MMTGIISDDDHSRIGPGSDALRVLLALSMVTFHSLDVIQHGLLSKADKEQSCRLEQLIRDPSFFFMPSRREVFGLAYCEVCAFGLPSIAADTGSVGTIVQNNVNDFLLRLDAGMYAYVEAICHVWSDAAAYRRCKSRPEMVSTSASTGARGALRSSKRSCG
jgi:glycosyltransferase involved in cell wall biosynthesis